MRSRLNVVVLITLLVLAGCSRSPAPQQQQPPAPDQSSSTPTAAPATSASPSSGADRRESTQRRDSSRQADRRSTQATAPSSSAAEPSARAEQPEREMVTIPADTVLHLQLETPVSSDRSHVEDPIEASVAKPVLVNGVEAVPAGAILKGVVTEAKPAGKVKGRAQLAFRFDQLTIGSEQERVQTKAVSLEAKSTKKKDALKIGAPAAGGAILGAILGGKKGAAIGGAVGGGAGTAVVLATPGEEVRLATGTSVTVKLLEPVTVRLRVDR